MSELIRLEAALLGYRRPVLGPVTLSVRQGERLAVLGPNGGGKTTLLKALVGLLPLLAGRRVVTGATPVRVGYVPQAFRADTLYPLTALEVTLQGRFGALGLFRRTKDSDWALARQSLRKVGLGDLENAQFRSLSGGQRQRVLLARALCGEPTLLFLDEFTSELDPAGTTALLGEVARLATEGHVSVVFITHEVSAAATYATHVALVDGRQAQCDTGPTAELLTGQRLSRLYGQPMSVERRDGRTIVYVESGEGGRDG